MFSFQNLAVYTLFLPLIASVLVGLNTRNMSAALSQVITSALVFLSAIFSIIIFVHVAYGHQIIHVQLFKWFDVSFFKAYWSIYVDSLTAVMLCVVNIISFLVHIYSIGYMSHDNSRQRFMSYLSLFTFFMLVLVTSDNLIQLFVGWEGVGLSSFLLIGFWFKKKSAAQAAIKAFLVNRVGDIGLALSIILIALTFKTVEYKQIFAQINLVEINQLYFSFFGIEFTLVDVICLLMFIGCMGKSAQIGLHTWLPDAMEGPTPVSALIHAATMVTAGVFLIARCSFIFEHSSLALNVVTIVGATTCLFAASIGIVQNDIKKIIAYSTCSQLGYMFFACGVSAYSIAVFHLMTHAFFKALLFLGAGSVIHGVHDEQDIRKMGGLYKYLPKSHILMWIGSLALSGIYPFAGYFSKDLILESAYLSNSSFGSYAFWMGIIAAFLTAFYSFRLLTLTFYGKEKLSKSDSLHIHDASKSMSLPMFVLAIGAVLSGYFGEHFLNMQSPSSAFWNDSLAIPNSALHSEHILPTLIKYMPLIVGVFGIFFALFIYLKNNKIADFISEKFKFIYQILINKYYFDCAYNIIFINSMKKCSNISWKVFDNSIIDGIPNLLARIIYKFSKTSRKMQTGSVNHYTLVMFMGLISIIILAVFY